MPEFFVLALPRSRTTWLSHFLSYAGKRCGHDVAAEADSVPDFLARLKHLDGSCETGAVVGWKLIRRHLPQARIVIIRRPISEIKESLAKFGVTPVDGELEHRRALLDECAKMAGVTSFDYGDLDEESTCAWIFERCLRLPFDAGWYRELKEQNIQVDVTAQIMRLYERRAKIAQFKADVAAEIAALEGAPCLA